MSFQRNPLGPDYGVIASWVRSSLECERWTGARIRFPFTAAELPGLIASKPPVVPGEVRGCLVLCRQSGEVVGYGELVQEDEHSFRLARIIICPENRSAGPGAALCPKLFEKVGAFPNAQRIRLVVYKNNRAIRLYGRLGFAQTPPHPSAEVLAMEKRIGFSARVP